jgi:hypothetical protein
MLRVLAIGLLAILVAACGGASDGGGGGQAAPSIAAPVVNGELPGLGNVLFGTSWDPATLGVIGKTASVKQGTTPLIVVGRTFTPVAADGVKVQITKAGSSKPKRAASAADGTETAQLFASDLSGDNLSAGTWIVNFLNKGGRIIASGNLVVTP